VCRRIPPQLHALEGQQNVYQGSFDGIRVDRPNEVSNHRFGGTLDKLGISGVIDQIKGNSQTK